MAVPPLALRAAAGELDASPRRKNDGSYDRQRRYRGLSPAAKEDLLRPAG